MSSGLEILFFKCPDIGCIRLGRLQELCDHLLMEERFISLPADENIGINFIHEEVRKVASCLKGSFPMS